MSRRKSQEQPQPADLTPDAMKAAIPKLRRRIEELQALDVETVEERSDGRIKSLSASIDDTLADIFGTDTADYQRYRMVKNLDKASRNIYRPTPIREVRDGLRRGVAQAVDMLSTVVRLFEEKLGDLDETESGRALRAIEGLDLHPEIERAAGKLFRDGHYANAVEDACKVLDGLVKVRSGRDDISGTTLMQSVFSPKSPILRFSEQRTESEQSEQRGMMFLYSGAMLAFRNPRAHEIVQDDPEMALELISFTSFLAKYLDKAERA
jgi:uncharacterized protein (TIGR02391 family)